jgi:hypothetical protein
MLAQSQRALARPPVAAARAARRPVVARRAAAQQQVTFAVEAAHRLLSSGTFAERSQSPRLRTQGPAPSASPAVPLAASRAEIVARGPGGTTVVVKAEGAAAEALMGEGAAGLLGAALKGGPLEIVRASMAGGGAAQPREGAATPAELPAAALKACTLEAPAAAPAAAPPEAAGNGATTKYVAWGGGLLPLVLARGLDSPLTIPGLVTTEGAAVHHLGVALARVLELPTEATELLELIEKGGVPGVSFVESSKCDGGCLVAVEPVWRSDGSRKHVVDPQSGLLVAVCQAPGSELQAIPVDTGLRAEASGVRWPLVQPRYLPIEDEGEPGSLYYLRVEAPVWACPFPHMDPKGASLGL